jgi:hypothetical protein
MVSPKHPWKRTRFHVKRSDMSAFSQADLDYDLYKRQTDSLKDNLERVYSKANWMVEHGIKRTR